MTDFYDLAPWQPQRYLLTDAHGRVYTAGLAGFGGIALSVFGLPRMQPFPLDYALSAMALDVTEQQPDEDTPDAWLALDDWRPYSGLAAVGQRGLRAEAESFEPLDGEARVYSKGSTGYPSFTFRAATNNACPGQRLVLDRVTDESPLPASARLSAVVGRAFISEFMSGYFTAQTRPDNADANQPDMIDATLAVNRYHCVIINQAAL